MTAPIAGCCAFGRQAGTAAPGRYRAGITLSMMQYGTTPEGEKAPREVAHAVKRAVDPLLNQAQAKRRL